MDPSPPVVAPVGDSGFAEGLGLEAVFVSPECFLITTNTIGKTIARITIIRMRIIASIHNTLFLDSLPPDSDCLLVSCTSFSVAPSNILEGESLEGTPSRIGLPDGVPGVEIAYEFRVLSWLVGGTALLIWSWPGGTSGSSRLSSIVLGVAGTSPRPVSSFPDRVSWRDREGVSGSANGEGPAEKRS